jgi:hypothetical protein
VDWNDNDAPSVEADVAESMVDLLDDYHEVVLGVLDGLVKVAQNESLLVVLKEVALVKASSPLELIEVVPLKDPGLVLRIPKIS